MSNFSILTNSGAYVALANLGGIQSALGQVQKKVSTGLQVADATDNAAVFAVAQGIRANLQQFNAVNTGLNDAQALVQTALTGATSVSNLIPQITATLTQLANSTINDQQRLTYTAQLKAQIDQIQTYLDASSYNGSNVIAANKGTLGAAGYTAWSNTAPITVLAAPGGGQLTVPSSNLSGQSNCTDGFLALARLAYQVGSSYSVSYSYSDVLLGTHFPFTTASISASGISVSGANSNALITSFAGFVSRSEIFANEAIAALAAFSEAGSVYYSPNDSAFVPSVFDGAVSIFSQQVNAALSSFGATANNIQLQLTFNLSIADSLTTGLGNLVDANLAQQSAQLTALQTQQQLAVQTLSIANSQPQTILSLFK